MANSPSDPPERGPEPIPGMIDPRTIHPAPDPLQPPIGVGPAPERGPAPAPDPDDEPQPEPEAPAPGLIDPRPEIPGP